MSTYKSDSVTIHNSAENVFSRLSNLENLKGMLAQAPADSIPADKREMLESITITPDSISVPAGPVGSLTFRVVEKVAPTLVKLSAENSPMPLTLALDITPKGAEECSARVDIDIAIPAMLKPMIGGQIQKMADQFGQMLKSIPFS